MENAGHDVITITPDQFRTFACPTYAEIRLAVWPGKKMGQLIENFRPCAIHIATEGTLGLAARNYCVKRGLPFTTAFHTRFPEYLQARFRVPLRWTYKVMRWFHGKATSVMTKLRSIGVARR